MDLNALQQKINNYTTVISSWVRNVGKLYFSGIPENVTVQLLGDNGNVVDTTLPNVAQFRKRVWDDVGGALGQFNRSLFVDAQNGSDTNDGSANAPFKTLSKAIGSVPVGGRAWIGIKAVHDLTKEPSHIYCVGKDIVICVGSDDIGNNYIVNDASDPKYIHLFGGASAKIVNKYASGDDAVEKWLFKIYGESGLFRVHDSIASVTIGDGNAMRNVNGYFESSPVRAWRAVCSGIISANLVGNGPVFEMNDSTGTVRRAYGAMLKGCTPTKNAVDVVRSLLQKEISSTPKVFFVDAQNGSDTNDGLNINSPFATAEKAVKEAGYLKSDTYIYIVSDATVMLRAEARGRIVFRAHESTPDALLTIQETADGYASLVAGDGGSLLFEVDVKIENTRAENETIRRWIMHTSENGYIHFGRNHAKSVNTGEDVNALLNIEKNSAIALRTFAPLRLDKTDVTNAQNAGITIESGRVFVNKQNCTINGAAATDSAISALLSGVITDASGTPVNLCSNFVFVTQNK